MKKLKGIQTEISSVKTIKQVNSLHCFIKNLLFLIPLSWSLNNYAQTAIFSTSTALPVDLDLGTAYTSCAAPGTKSFSFTVSGVPTLNTTTNQLAEINLRLDATCGASLTTIQCWLKSPTGTCVQISSTMGTTTNYTNSPQNRLDYTFRNNVSCLNKYPDYAAFPSTISAVSDANSRYGIFSTVGNIASGYNGENPNGTWTLYFSEGTASAPCLSQASLVFGDPTSTDQTANGDNCTGAIVWNGAPICAMTNGKTPSTNMPGWLGPGGANFTNFAGGATCDWNGANNNDVWIKFTPSTANVCIAISGIVDNLQSVIVTDPNTDGDNSPCTGAGGGTYWSLVSCPRSGPDDIYAAVTGTNRNQNHCFTATPGQTYYLVVDGNGGSESAFYVTGISGFCAASAPSVTGTTICSGTSTTLNLSSPSGTNNWFTTITGSTSFNTGNSYTTPNLTGNTTYYVESTNGGCTSSRTAVTVTVTAAPTITSANTTSICSGVALNQSITSSVASSYTWVAANNTNTTGESTTDESTSIINNTIINNTSSSQDVIYTITPTSTVGACLGTAQTLTVTVNPLPSAVGTNTAVCAGSLIPAMNFTTTPVTGVNVSWNNSNTNIGLAANGTGNITGYTSPSVLTQQVATITVVSTNTVTGCISSSATVATFTINPIPTVSAVATPLNPSSCGGTNGTLTGFTVAGTGVISYSWNTNPVQNTQNATGLAAGSYTVVATDANGCNVTANYSLSDPTTPTAPAFSINTNSICEGGSATLSVSTPIVGQTYNWTGPTGSLGTGTSITISPATLAQSGSYNVYTTAAGCTGSANVAAAVTLTVNANPVAGITSISTSLCRESSLVLNSSSTPGGTATIPAAGYQWSLDGTPIAGATSSSYSATLEGSYALLVTNSNGCSNTFTPYPISFYSEPELSTSGVINTNSNCVTPTGSISGVTISGGNVNYTYTWAGASGTLSTNTSASTNAPALINQPAGSYTLTVVDANSCNDTTLAFTINNDVVPVAPLVATNNPSCSGSAINPVTLNDVTNTITWYPDAALTSVVGTGNPFTPVTVTTHTLYATSTSNGCSSASTQVVVTINPKPIAPTASGNTYCVGNTIADLTSSVGSGTINWYSDASLTTIVGAGSPYASGISNTVAGTTTLYVAETALGCLGDPTAVNVIVNANPVIDISTSVIDSASCTTGSTDGGISGVLVSNGNPGYTFEWSNLTGIVSSSSVTADLNGVGIGSYTLHVIDNNGCEATSSPINIISNASPITPVFVTSSDTVYCIGETVGNLSATGQNIEWYSDPALTNLISTGSTITPTGITTDSVIYVASNNNGCLSLPRALSIAFNPLPNVSANYPVVCAGAQATLNGTGASNYVWDNGVTDGTPFTPTLSGPYTVTGTDVNGCVNTATVSITINSIPIVGANVGTSTSVCNGSTITLSGTGANTYLWDNNVTNGNSFAPTIPGPYIVNGTDLNGCVNTATVTITINNLPTVSANSPTVCFGQSTSLNGSGALTYTWDNGITNGVSFTPSASGLYIVTGTDVNGCVDLATVLVNVNQLPNVGATQGTSVNVCNGSSITLNGTGANTYSWDNNVTDDISFTPSVTGPYIVSGTDGNGCVNTFTVNLTVNQLPIVDVSAVSNIIPCGSNNFILTGATSTATNPNYTWSGPSIISGANTATPTIGGGGVFVVAVTDANNCTSFNDTLVITANLVNAAFAPDVTSGFAPLPINFTNLSTGAISYAWTFGNGDSTSTLNATTIYTQPGNYNVTLIASSNGCYDTATVSIFVDATSSIVIPNIFSPNGDQINDILTITSIGIKELSIDVFNRWGQKIYVIESINKGWDGIMINGEMASEGTYYFIVNATGFDEKKHEVHGAVMLVK